MSGYKIDLPYSGKSAGLYEKALSDFLIGKPTPASALITFNEAGKTGYQLRTRQIKWPAGASIPYIVKQIAEGISQTYSSVARVFMGATVDFRI